MNASPILENERVRLRVIEPGDYIHLLPFSLHEPGLWRYSRASAAGAEQLTLYIQKALQDMADGHSLPFIVYDKKAESYAGCTRFYDIEPLQKTLLLGYTWYGAAFQGTGLNKHCKYLLLQYVFETLGYERVELRVDTQNARSIAAVKSIGCKEEGVLESNQAGPCSNSLVFAMLKSEWDNGLKDALQHKCR